MLYISHMFTYLNKNSDVKTVFSEDSNSVLVFVVLSKPGSNVAAFTITKK